MRIQHWFQALVRQVEECPLPCGWVRCSLIAAAVLVLGTLFAITVLAGNNHERFGIANEDSDRAVALVHNRHVDPPLSYTEASKDECTSRVCRWNANYLFYGYRMRGDPCDDFYEHVCSAFETTAITHQLPYPHLSIRQLILDLDLFMSRYSKIKKRRTLSGERNFLAQAMWLHSKCKSAHRNDRGGDWQPEWADILGTLQLSAWPYSSFEGDLVNVVSAGDRYLMLRSLFSVKVVRSKPNNRPCEIVLKEPQTYLKHYASRRRNNVVKQYEDIIFGAVTRYSNAFTGALVSRQITKLELLLQNLTYLHNAPPELVVKGASVIHGLPKGGRWDWVKYLTSLFDTDRDTARSAVAIVEHPAFFGQFASVFTFENYRTAIANYVGFKAMVTLAPLMPPGYAELYELGYGFNIPELEPQLRACTLLVERIYRYGTGIAAKLTLSREFANVYRHHRDIQLEDLFNKTRVVLRQLLGSGRSWFSTGDLEQALRRLDNMSIVFGAQDNFVQYEQYRHTLPWSRESNVSLLGAAFTLFSHASRKYWSAWKSRDETGSAYDNEYHMSVFEWGHDYEPSNNLVFLPNAVVAFLTDISSKIPVQMYPVVLVHIVRGMLKALLRSNSAFVDGHVIRRSWWHAASVCAIENVTKCVQRQYRIAAAAENAGGVGYAGRWSVARVEEALIDNSALLPLYELYERVLSKHNATNMFYRLSDWRVTMRQLFFYNYAVAFCDHGDNESRRVQHWLGINPSKWRLNVPLRNFPPFRKTFSCSDWKPPELQCDTWKGAH